MASVIAIQAQLNNRAETQKLYIVLSQFNMFNNPLKHYARKMKVKRIIPSCPSNPIEHIIIPAHLINTTIAGSIAGSIGGSGTSDGIKPRKKMKITEMSNDAEPESPKTAKPTEEETNIIIFKPNEYEKIKNTKYSVVELRTLCKFYGVKKSGTKQEMTTRLYTHLLQSHFIVRIQRIFRKYISMKYRKLCGPGYLHTADCINDTDFYTFDRLADINPTELFTYRDIDDKIYGFHIASIYHLIISSYPTILNPYNRKVITANIINKLYEKLIYGSLLGFRVSIKLDDSNNDENGATNTDVVNPSGGGGGGGMSRERQEELFVVDLFQHINTLGNYSDSEWFNTLQREELIRFIRNLHDIWNYRANLSQDTKERICPPVGNPFVIQHAHVNMNIITLLSDAEIRTLCVSVIDKMTRRGITREDQCLGAFYVLATLTIVNQNARNALPWLYEAVI
ncbi:MAG: hypothetical protein EBU66_16775 [Bacteroidetes bacterium]|nr:hypothetical protein [bacterium]NBP66291.1 hypothetical protein [Bacteroidota bacterium]